jgi:hypothetical protein
MFINSTDNGETWSAPIRVNDDPLASNAWQWFGTMSVAPNGRIDAIWADTRVSGATNLSAIFYSYSTDGGNTWSANEQVSPVFDSWIGWPNQSKIGDYYHMWSDDDGASLAYSATFKGGQDVYYLRLSIDCNGNGVRDACDVACGNPGGVCDVPQCGQSQDCNLNSIPDECETGSDCNENGFPDQCDIAAGTSLDSNDDGIPDECEGACCRCDCDLALPVGCTGGVFQGVGTVCGDAPCPPVDPDCSAAVFWVSRGLGKVMQARLDGSGIRSVVAGLDDAHAVAVDSVTATLYWGEEGTTHRISRGNLDGSSPEVFISGTRARHLTIDEAARKLYWFDAYEDNIYRINLDGSGQQLVASEPFNDEVIGFSICPAAGHLFWSFRLGSVSLWGIRRANLDGSDVTGILSKAFPLRDIALSSNDVYYGQDPGLAIGRVEFDGTESDSILPGADPLRLTIDEGGGHVYWSSFQDYIGRADLDGTPSMVFISQAGDPRGIAVARVDCDGNGVRDDCDRSCGLVDGFCDMSGCGLGIDCDQNRMLDRCEIAVRPLLDCNNNSTLDICDIASGNSLDEDDNQVPDECCPLPCALPPLPEAADVGQDRFVSFVVSPTSEPRTIALRVRLAVLHDTAAPPNAPDFSALEGQYRYVNSYRDGQGNVIPDCPDSVLLGTSFKCATLGCQPEYRDWAGDLDGQPLHISASAVVPSSTLAISQVPLFCQGSETDCLAASAELLVTTRRWGDIVDTGALPVNALDIAAVVNKVKDIAGAVSEPRGMLQPKNPAPHTAAVGAVDIGRAVDAVKGWPYPFTIDSCP